MSLSSAAVSPQRARDPAGPRGLIAARVVTRLDTLLALRALAGDRLGITIPAPDLKFIDPSISAAQPVHPQKAGRDSQHVARLRSALSPRRKPPGDPPH
ncbi:MAG: hypothetical protein ACTHMY_22725 [Solirubrobacteraceae bacterium]